MFSLVNTYFYVSFARKLKKRITFATHSKKAGKSDENNVPKHSIC